MKEYGELMSLLLHYRERYPNDEEFRRFIIDSLRTFVYDLRDFDVEISLSLDCWRRDRVSLPRPSLMHTRRMDQCVRLR